jgi:hypothetical protein
MMIYSTLLASRKESLYYGTLLVVHSHIALGVSPCLAVEVIEDIVCTTLYMVLLIHRRVRNAHIQQGPSQAVSSGSRVVRLLAIPLRW